MKNTSVAIVGGGIGGLACALALAQRQFPVLLLEQAPLPPLRTLCRRLAYRLHRALAVLPLISVQRF